MKQDIKIARLLQYILGRRPDEFGLVPDARGYIALKEVIKVLNEERWPHVRPNHLETLPYRVPTAGIEIRENRIRASERGKLPVISACDAVPKQLYACIRRKAYTATAENGLAPQIYPDKVLLFVDRELARRVGRRRDAEPVLVTIQTTVAQQRGVQFERFGENVYLTARIPADCCRLPAPPKPVRSRKQVEEDQTATPPQPPGSYILEWDRLISNTTPPKAAGKKSKQWRRERQRLRRLKRSSGDYS